MTKGHQGKNLSNCRFLLPVLGFMVLWNHPLAGSSPKEINTSPMRFVSDSVDTVTSGHPQIDECIPLWEMETMPVFNEEGEGLNAVIAFLTPQLIYPTEAEEQGIQGRVIVTFIVERDGSVTHAEILMSPDRDLAREALRVVNALPKWKSPGYVDDKAVRVRINLPIEFTFLYDESKDTE